MSNHWFNSNQCRQNVVYQRYPRDAQNANTRDAPWDGPYRITYSDLTSTDSLPQTTNHLTRLLYECDWIGVIGTAHDDKGPVPGLIVTIYEWLPGGNVNAWFIPTGDIPFMNQSGWAIELEAGKRYFIDVTNHRGQSAVSEIFYFPPVESCDQRVMLIEVSQEVR
jgi:hypothetical protein